MSVSFCRCCGLSASSSRLTALHRGSRSISTSSTALEKARVPPARDWGSKEPTRKPTDAKRDLSGLGKWTRQDDSSSGPRRDTRRYDGGGSGGGGGFGSARGDRFTGGADKWNRNDGSRSSQSGYGGGGGGLGKWARNDGPRGGGRDGAKFGLSGQDGPRRDGYRDRSGSTQSRFGDSRSHDHQPRDPVSTFGLAPAGRAADKFANKSSSQSDRPDRRATPSRGGYNADAGAMDTYTGEGNDFEIDKDGARRRRRPVKSSMSESGELLRGRYATGKPSMREQALTMEERMRAKDAKQKERQAQLLQEDRSVTIPSTVTVGRLATIFGLDLFTVQTRMQRSGLPKEKQRPDYMLTTDEATDVALEFGFNPVVDDEAAFDLVSEPEKAGEVYPLRPPVVTIMGHVDHGKTTLLDALRNTAVAAGEAGGITQHIGAFSVPLKLLSPDTADSKATITFLDTPGHAAFTAMRARGASATDIVVLVVAADDGVMPQTREVLNLVKAEGDKVGLVVAINKIDKPGVDVEKVKSALGEEGIFLEEDGGDVQSVRVSGLARLGLDNLVETLSTLAELRDLRGRVDGKAEGVVLESNVDKGAGRVATVLVTRGTLSIGTVVVAGTATCKVRRMTDHTGKALKTAGPGTPVVVSGWKEIPAAGDELLEAPNGEAEAKKAIANRIAMADRIKVLKDTQVINQKRKEDRDRLNAEQAEEEAVKAAGGNLYETRLRAARQAAAEAKKNEFKELRLVIKGDVSGTVEAVEGALSGIGNKEAGVKVLHTGVGEVTESDVDLAEASEALIIGFNVSAQGKVKQAATVKGVDLHLEGVIYRLIETVREKTAALLPPTIESKTIGEGTVLSLFSINIAKRQHATIAGSRCTNGTINRQDQVRVLRGAGREVVFEGKIETLKHLKQEVNEVRRGMEFGLQIEGFSDIQEGDEIVTFKTFEVPRKL